MNSATLKLAAQHLRDEAEVLVSNGDHEVARFLETVRPLIEQAMREHIAKPMQWQEIPGAWQFSEGNLRDRPSLESAYAKFKIELTGGESPVLQRLREKGIQE